ncbi:MAG: ABC transporter substrate-binding protein [Lachnospiraceae bacterium]|nr:ABC transporter substrate-binding protein [Lachnospiraceae bacterium]
MKIKKVLSVALSAAMVMGCFGMTASAEEELTWKIGVIGPMTGDYAQYGLGVYQAAVIAADEINAAGGINGYQVEILDAGDDQGDAEQSVNAYNNLLDQGMQLLCGTVTSGACIAVSAEAYGSTFLLTPSATALEAINGADAYQFRMCFTDPMQGTVAAQQIEELGLASSVAILYDSAADYNVGIHDAFVEAAADLSFEIVEDQAYTTDSNTDFSVQLTKIQESGAELVFLPNYYSDNALIFQQAADIGLDVVWFGVDGMDGILEVENFDTSLAEGVMMLCSFSATATDDLTVSFVEAYEAAYDAVPNQFAADGYDVIYSMKAAIEDAGATPDMSNEELAEAVAASMLNITVDKLTGESSWTEDGECTKEPKVYKIVDGAYEIVE